MRRILIAGNWKMNLIDDISPVVEFCNSKNIDVLICPPFTHIEKYSKMIEGSDILLGAQNMHSKQCGAFTGEISSDFLKIFNVKYVILGHSERRQLFKESDEMIQEKVQTALVSGLKPILCVGEREFERLSNKHKSIVENQLKIALGGIENNFKNIIIAYEPVWAIGTGKTATPFDACDMHGFIREQLSSIFGRNIASEIRILYGGSVNENNVKDMLRQDDIDGALIGGASISCEKFLKILKTADKTNI